MEWDTDFSTEVARLAGDSRAYGLAVVRGDTPEALLDIGMPDLPMLHTRAHIIMETAPYDPYGSGHGVDPETLAALPELLEDPVAVIESGTRPGVLMVVLDAVAGPFDEPLTAMVNPDVPVAGSADPGERANFVLSAYGRGQVIHEVARAFGRCDTLLYDHARFWALAAKCRPADERARIRARDKAMRERDGMGIDGGAWGQMGTHGHRRRM